MNEDLCQHGKSTYLRCDACVDALRAFNTRQPPQSAECEPTINWHDKYMRDVEGLNNEGDPVGGDPACGMRQQIDQLRALVEQQSKKLDECVTEMNRLQAALHDDLNNFIKQRDTIEQQKGEIEKLKRGEFICNKCGIRKDSEKVSPHDF